MSSALSSCNALIPRAIRVAGLPTLVALLGLGLSAPLRGADRSGEFIAGLRARGWHDVVLEYLARAEEDPLATPEFLDRISYEQAVTLTALSKASIRESERIDLSNQAIELFQSYAAGHRDDPLYFDAMSKAGSLLTEQALGKLAKANRLPSGATGELATLRSEARAELDLAINVIDKLLVACEEKLATLPQGALARQDPEAPITRQQLTVKQAETSFLRANLLFETAKTYEPGSDKFSRELDAAAQAFAELYKDYSDKLVGFYGRLYEGRCYQLSGKLNDALECFADLVDQPISNADFRRLVARAYRRRAECHLEADDLDDAIDECRDWLNDSRGAELKQSEWLAVAYRLAEAYRLKAALADASEATRLRSEARQLFREVSREPGEFQADARTALASGNGENNAPISAKVFDEAFAAGNDALERMKSSKLAARLAAENNPDSVAELNQQAEHHQAVALRLFQTAIGLADEESNLEDLLAVRYYLCWIYWEDQHLHEAAVLGEFLALRYPESSYAIGAAKVALAAQEKLYLQAKHAGEDGSYEAAQLASLAESVTRLWPDSAEAGAAVNLLIQIALADDRLDDAEQLLNQLPASNRAQAQLSLGSALWIQYLRLIATRPDEIGPDALQLKERASQLLSGGYDALSESTNPSAQVANGVLYYVQLLLAKGEFDRAVTVLENRSVGPLSMVESGRLQHAAFAYEAFKVALRAYISVDPPQRDKAEEMMTALEATIDPNDNPQKLTRIYLSLGRQLQQQISDLSNRGQMDQVQGMVAALEDLLERITKQGGSGDWRIRNRIAQTNMQLGEGLSGEAARPFLEQAEKIYRGILADVKKNPDDTPKGRELLVVRKQLGDCLRARLKFDEAFKQYAEILRERPNSIELQKPMALMLQQWGHDHKRSDKLDEAIRGSLPQSNKKNLVWGWRRLADIAEQQKAAAGPRATQPNQKKFQKYHDLFFEAWYQMAKTRLLAAKIASGKKRDEQLNSARRNVESMKRLYPELGGPKWQKAFDELLDQIEAEKSA